MTGLLPLLAASAWAATVSIRWDYRDLPKAMRVHEYDASTRLPLWKMGEVSDASRLPAGPEIKGANVALRPGETRKLVLVYRNETKGLLRFFAAPHHVKPPEASLGFEFACLCTNHVYAVEPGRLWYRVVELGLHEDFEGDTLEVRHVLVRVKKKTP
ncbi:MAG: hypothetical protein HY553_11540 [Elusimicrobia bacterium]|nr:hypothetical protein [Elusimicrobiota bacterium]